MDLTRRRALALADPVLHETQQEARI